MMASDHVLVLDLGKAVMLVMESSLDLTVVCSLSLGLSRQQHCDTPALTRLSKLNTALLKLISTLRSWSHLKLFSILYLSQARMTRSTPPVDPMMRREAKF